MKKRIIAFVCVLALLLSTPIASVEAASASDTYKVGFSKVDITPKTTGLPLGGYGDTSTRTSVGTLTPKTLRNRLLSNGYTSEYLSIPSTADSTMYLLYASCVAITDKTGTTMLMLSLDVNDCPNSLSATLRKAITKATGVPDENITITATHTHSAPDLNKAGSAAYAQTLNDLLATCALEAMENQASATMWQNTTEVADMNYVRHYYTDATDTDANGEQHVKGSNFGSQYGSEDEHVKDPDDDMHLLMFDFADTAKDNIVLCNWRGHPCFDSSDTLFSHTNDTDVYHATSSDYIGAMRTILKGEGYDLLFLQGTAGNIVTESKLNSTTKSSYTYGNQLAQELIDGLSGMTQMDTGLIQTNRVYMQTESVKYSSSDLQYAKKVQAFYTDLLNNGELTNSDLETLMNESTYPYWNGTSYDTKKVSDYYNTCLNNGITQNEAHDLANTLAWAKGYGSRYHINNIITNASSTSSASLQLNAITLGPDIAFVAAPVELFDSYDEVNNTPVMQGSYGACTFVMGYTNGYHGYLPSKAAFEYNATETANGTVCGGSYEVHTTDFDKGTGEQVIKTLETMLDDMGDRSYCPCVGTHTDKTQCKEVKWGAWVDSNGDPITDRLPSSGNYYLTEDVTVSGSTELQGTLNLDLNGKTIRGANGIFTMAKNDHLVVTDSYAGGQLGVSGVTVTANAGSKLTVYAGTIGGTVKNNGATVTLRGTPSMYINMAKNAPAMDCHGLQEGANVYVVSAYDQCFAKVDSINQKSCFRAQNDHVVRYEDGGLYLTSRQYLCVCAGTLEGDPNHTCTPVSWQAWTKTDSLPTTEGNYYLNGHVYLESEQVIEADQHIRLDLNGKTVYVGQKAENGELVVTENGIRAYYIPSGSTLELTSSTYSGTGTINGVACAPELTDRSGYGGVIYADSGSTLNLYSNITIKGNRASSKRTATAVRGGCVYSLGTMNMYGGTITDGCVPSKSVNSNAAGGNVYTSGTFAMYGGSITNGKGNVINLCIDDTANAIIGGTSYVFSGVYVDSAASLTLTGAPHIPDWPNNSIAGISFAANTPINATGLDTQAMVEDSHYINIKKSSDTGVIATVNTLAQANLFRSYSASYGVQCYKDGTEYKVALYSRSAGDHSGCICAGKLVGADNHTCDIQTWQPWTETDSLPTSGYYYLAADVEVSARTEVNGTLNLDLNGRTVTATGSQQVFDVGSGDTLRITDFATGGIINADDVQCDTSSTTSKDINGGVVYVEGGTFELYGGTLQNNGTFVNGGVIYTASASSSIRNTICIYGGTITGTAAQYGGGMYLYRTTFDMYGGTITDCTAGRGGSIYLYNASYATIYGGIIENGTAIGWDDNNARGGNIHLNAGTCSLTVEGGEISGGTASNNNGNGGNICVSSGKAYINAGLISGGSAVNQGGNIAVMGTSSYLYMTGGEVCNPVSSSSIGLWNNIAAEVSGGKIYGAAIGITNNNGNLTLKDNAYIYGNTTSNISMVEIYKVGDDGSYVSRGSDYVLGTLTVDSSFVGTASVAWGSITTQLEGIAPGAVLPNTVSSNYADTGTLLWEDENLPIAGKNGNLHIATVGIADGDSPVSHHTDLADALNAYALEESADQKYIQLYADQHNVNITESIYLDLNGFDMSVASVDADCKIYGMDSVTNQYTHYGADGADVSGKLTLDDSIDDECIVKNVPIHLTKGATQGTRKYLALKDGDAYTFHRYYLSLTEVGLRPKDAGIFYNAVFYGDEAVAAAVTEYGVEVSRADDFMGTTIKAEYIAKLDMSFKSGVLGNTGARTVLTNIIPANGTASEDYSNETVYGRAYIEVGDIILHCSNTGSTNLRTLIGAADIAYGNNAFSAAQKTALDDMYTNYSHIMNTWNILKNIGLTEINIGDFFIKDPKDDDELNILLIGNSFCYYWVEELYGLLVESGYPEDKVNITNVYYSGCSLQQHWNWKETGAANYEIWVTNKDGRNRDKENLYNLESVISGQYAKNWDFISLQQSSGSFRDVNSARETLEPYLGNLLRYLRSKYPKAEYMWHQVWAYEVGHSNVDNLEEQTASHDTIVAIGGEVSQLYGLTTVPTGLAWAEARRMHNEEAYLPYGGLCARKGYNSFDGVTSNSGDGYHDGDIGGGQLLNAYVWYKTITGDADLSDNNYVPATDNLAGYELSSTMIAKLKQAAMTSFNVN